MPFNHQMIKINSSQIEIKFDMILRRNYDNYVLGLIQFWYYRNLVYWFREYVYGVYWYVEINTGIGYHDNGYEGGEVLAHAQCVGTEQGQVTLGYLEIKQVIVIGTKVIIKGQGQI